MARPKIWKEPPDYSRSGEATHAGLRSCFRDTRIFIGEGVNTVKQASDRELVNSLKVINGPPQPKGRVVFSMMKDESFFVEAFFEHYRNLNADAFLVFDDGSTDGTLEFLLDQPDTTVLSSSFGYGEIYKRRGALPWRGDTMRAGIRLKGLIPTVFLFEQWCIYADADEFLILPDCMEELRECTRLLDRGGVRVVLASLVEFYPEKFRDLRKGVTKVTSFGELIRISQYFDAVPLLRIDSSGSIERLNRSASGRLFAKYGIPFGSKLEVHSKSELRASGGKAKLAIGSATHKLPLIKAGGKVRLLGSHRASVNPSSEITLALAHFKFTPDVLRRTETAIATKAWSQGSAKYSNYKHLFDLMERSDGSFLCGESRRYEEPRQMEECGNLWWGALSDR